MHLLVLFTYGISLRVWADKGLLEREIQLYKALSKKGVNVTFLTYGDNDDLEFKEVCSPVKILPVYSRLTRPKWKWLAFFQSFLIPLYLKESFKNSDILKTNQMLGSWVAILASKLYRKPLIVRTGFTWSLFALRKNNFILHRFASLVERISYRNADIAVVATPNDADYISGKYSISTDKLKIIPNHVNTDLFSIIDGDKYKDRIIFVGRLTEQKNLKNLIQALYKLPYSLDIYGNGELKEEIGQLAKSLKVRVNFMGNVPNSEMPEILSRYYVFVLPSFYEGMPKSLLEAMSCGMVVIGTKVNGIQEIIQDGVNGFLCETTSQSIREVVLKVFSHLDQLSDLRKKAREYMIENCRLEMVVTREMEIYNQVKRL